MLRVVLCNCKPEESHALARTLVEERLAACVNIVPGITSFYVWQDKLCEDQEHTLLIKTTDERYEALKSRIQELHSYEVPEIVSLQSVDVLQSYAQWVDEQVCAKR
ncbi:MAG: divalent-cation tolerance protein CutA [Bradymonadaceae bacterium]|nr:divalent-cation tolerance protein CutA [Lujinxingiaceae bacterium]